MKKYDFLIPPILALIYFLAVKDVLPMPVFITAASAAALYFLPGKLLQLTSPHTGKLPTEYILSNILFFLLIAGSVMLQWRNCYEALKLFYTVLAITNFISALWYSISKKPRHECLIHITFIIFSSGVVTL
jgi:hypothetical protein